MIDQYRVTLFKKKIREINPDIEEIRLYFSVDKTHLIFEPRRYVREKIVADKFIKSLHRNEIDFSIKKDPFGFYSDLPDEEKPIWWISIPIDQEALPERKR